MTIEIHDCYHVTLRAPHLPCPHPECYRYTVLEVMDRWDMPTYTEPDPGLLYSIGVSTIKIKRYTKREIVVGAKRYWAWIED